MSHDLTEDSNTYITIVPENDALVPAVEFSNNNVDCVDAALAKETNSKTLEAERQSPHQLETSNNGETRRQQYQENIEGSTCLEYKKGYPIMRYSRSWKRPEVQGFCCLAVEIACVITLGVLGLQGVGYFDIINKDTHLPLTFSWKLLWEFFGNAALPKKVLDCLSTSMRGKLFVREEESFGMLQAGGSLEYGMFVNSFDSSSNDEGDMVPATQKPDIAGFDFPWSITTDSQRCTFHQGRSSIGWLLYFFLITHPFPVVNICTSSLLYTSVSVRRRKGLQVLLLLPSFFCFFVSIFNQISISFHYNTYDQVLIKEMSNSLRRSSPPFFIVPMLDETQVHRQCCGVEMPETWERFGKGSYPPSCCNSNVFNCSSLEVLKRKHVWPSGCFPLENEKIYLYERAALFLHILKVTAEVGIFCTLSELTRFDYPPAESVETSRCDYRDYQIKCRGVMHVKGVTKDGRIVIESKYFLPWRLIPSRTDMLHGLQLYLKTDVNRRKGSVEIVKRHAVNFLNEDIQVDLSRKNKGVYIFTLM